MINILKHVLFMTVLIFFVIQKYTIAEPIVVLEYSVSKDFKNNNSKSFKENENYSSFYVIKKNDSLSDIINNFYGNMNLNLRVVQSAVVLKNRHAFVRNNANFMFANKKLYLPSINEIKDSVYKNKKRKQQDQNYERVQDIYFFGN